MLSSEGSQASRNRNKRLKKRFIGGELGVWQDLLEIREGDLKVHLDRAADLLEYTVRRSKKDFRGILLENLDSYRPLLPPRFGFVSFFRNSFLSLGPDECRHLAGKLRERKPVMDRIVMLHAAIRIYDSFPEKERSHLTLEEAGRAIQKQTGSLKAADSIPYERKRYVLGSKAYVDKTDLGSFLAEISPGGRRHEVLVKKNLNVSEVPDFLDSINPYLDTSMKDHIIRIADSANDSVSVSSLISSYLKMDERFFERLRCREQFPLSLDSLTRYIDKMILDERRSESRKDTMDYITGRLGSSYIRKEDGTVKFNRASFTCLKDLLALPLSEIPEYDPPTEMFGNEECLDLLHAVRYLGTTIEKLSSNLSGLDPRSIDDRLVFPMEKLIDYKNRHLRLDIPYQK